MADIKIADFCDPIFQQVVKWGLESDAEHPIDTDNARATLNNLIDRLRLASRQQPKIGQQFVQVELPLLFFIDFVLQDRIHLTSPWPELAFERNELAGDEKFFDLLEQTLGSPTDTATDRVEVFYQCMALGFCGTYSPQSPELHRIFRRCALRLGLSPDLVESGQLTPEAYEHLDLVSKHRPFDPRKWRWSVAICVACLVITHFSNQWVFRAEVEDIRRQLDKIGAYSNLSPAPSVIRKADEIDLDRQGKSESESKQEIILPDRPEAFGSSSMYRMPKEGDGDEEAASLNDPSDENAGKQRDTPPTDAKSAAPSTGDEAGGDPAVKTTTDDAGGPGSSTTDSNDASGAKGVTDKTEMPDASSQEARPDGGSAPSSTPGNDAPTPSAPKDSNGSSSSSAPETASPPAAQPDSTTQTVGNNQ